jgi:hypothetical protein
LENLFVSEDQIINRQHYGKVLASEGDYLMWQDEMEMGIGAD